MNGFLNGSRSKWKCGVISEPDLISFNARLAEHLPGYDFALIGDSIEGLGTYVQHDDRYIVFTVEADDPKLVPFMVRKIEYAFAE